MNKEDKIDKFLLYVQNIMDYNPNLTENEMYSLLVYYNSSGEVINHLHLNWINHFANHKNIKVFVSKTWKYFCQFTNDMDCDISKMIKLYIPLKEQYICDGANIIFEYLEQNNIKHHSKIGSHCRNDSIVVRVNSIADAHRIADFVKNNAFLQNSLSETNPLVFNYNNVGMAFDGNKSFNQEVSRVLWNYFCNRKHNCKSSKPSSKEFRNYLQQVMLNVHDDELLKIYNLLYQNISNKNFNFENYASLVNEFQNNDYLLLQCVRKTSLKYGQQQSLLALIELLKGDTQYITNDFQCRDMAKCYLSSYQVKNIITKLCGFHEKHNLNTEDLMTFINKAMEMPDDLPFANTLIKSSMITANKYGDGDIYRVIYTFLNTNNYEIFTRDNGARAAIKHLNIKGNLCTNLKMELGLSPETPIKTLAYCVSNLYKDNDYHHNR